MYKQLTLILISLLIAPTLVHADDTDNPQKLYLDFKKNYETLITGSPTKSDFIKNYNNLENKLNQLFEDYISKRERLLSRQAFQMSINLEMLKPLKKIADSQLSAESCNEALHDNEVNAPANPEAASKIKALINKICKK